MSSTKNFSVEQDPKLACTCGHEDCDKRVVRQEVLDMLQEVRDLVDHPMIVTSGGRCPNHPNEVHRSQPADHQKCQGIDIKVGNGVERGELVLYGMHAGFNSFGVAKTFIHLGYREGAPLVIWEYS